MILVKDMFVHEAYEGLLSTKLKYTQIEMGQSVRMNKAAVAQLLV